MFKKELSALLVLPLLSKKFNSYIFFARILKPTKAVLSRVHSLVSVVCQKWVRMRQIELRASFISKTTSILGLFLIFFMVTPQVAVKANYKETLIPAPKPELFRISDSIQADTVIHFTTPVRGYISTFFSFKHQGIDIPNPYGAPVKAASDGEVTYASWSSLGYGNCVIIRHKMGFETLYAHMSKLLVKVGNRVQEGALIGLIGATGDATGNHLHLEVHLKNSPVNPLLYLDPRI